MINVDRFTITDTIGSIDFCAREIKSFIAGNENYLIKGGLCDGKGEFDMLFDIHPLHREQFLNEYVPKLKEICQKHGISGEWHNEVKEPKLKTA